MRRLITAAFICLFFSTPASALVTYSFQPSTPSIEGFNWEGRLVVTNDALSSGSASLTMEGCLRPDAPKCIFGATQGIVEFVLEYQGPGSDEIFILNPFNPISEEIASTDRIDLSATLGETMASVGFTYYGIFVSIVTSGDEIYITGSDHPESCGRFPETVSSCRGATGSWVRVPEPSSLGLVITAVAGLGFTLRSSRRHLKTL